MTHLSTPLCLHKVLSIPVNQVGQRHYLGQHTRSAQPGLAADTFLGTALVPACEHPHWHWLCRAQGTAQTVPITLYR